MEDITVNTAAGRHRITLDGRKQCKVTGVTDVLSFEMCIRDRDGVVYILKEHIEGRECSYRSEEDIRQAFAVMAKLHLIMTRAGQQEGFEADFQLPVRNLYWQEMNKHTRECRHIQNYLRHLKSKTDFERELLRRYDYFMEKAQHITDLAAQELSLIHI